jgi:hypothetical protein
VSAIHQRRDRANRSLCSSLSSVAEDDPDDLVDDDETNTEGLDDGGGLDDDDDDLDLDRDLDEDDPDQREDH